MAPRIGFTMSAGPPTSTGSLGQCTTDIGANRDQLVECIQNAIDGLKQKVPRWRRRAFGIRLSTAILGALISITAGWKGDPSFWIFAGRENWILILGALIAVINAWGAFFNHREMWLTNAAACDRLTRLVAELRGPNLDQTLLERVFKEYLSVLDDKNQKWTEINTKHNTSTG
jgi:hypothetical protein